MHDTHAGDRGTKENFKRWLLLFQSQMRLEVYLEVYEVHCWRVVGKPLVRAERRSALRILVFLAVAEKSVVSNRTGRSH